MEQPVAFITIVNSLFDQIMKHGELTDEILRELNVLFPTVLVGALEILDKNNVIMLKAMPSGRTLFVVKSSGRSFNKKRQNMPSTTGSVSDSYKCLSLKFCTCQSFIFQIVNKRESIYCKHLLAVRIAQALGSYTEQTITDMEFASHAV